MSSPPGWLQRERKLFAPRPTRFTALVESECAGERHHPRDTDRRADEQWLNFLLTDLPSDPSARAKALDERLTGARWPRYRAGWARYVDAVGPRDRASVVVDNNDFAAPGIVRTA